MEVKEVVKRSVETLSEIYPQETKRDLRLEEVRLSDDEVTWSTTFSFRNPDKPDSDEPAVGNSLEALFGANRPKFRTYKTVRLRSADGKLLGILNGS